MEPLDTPVADAMSTPLRTVPGRTSVREAAGTIADEPVGSLVVAADRRGVLTKTDVVRGLRDGVDPDRTTAAALMSAPPVTVRAEADLQTAVDRMAEHGIKRLVVERDGEAVGMVTTTDLVAELSPDLDQIVDMFAP